MRILLIALCSFGLTACVNQETADEKMSKGCKAGVVKILTEKNRQIHNIKSIDVSNTKTNDGEYRQVTISALEKNGWLELDREYTCAFAEDWGVFKTSHNATLMHVEVHGEIYGKKDGGVLNGLEKFISLTNTVTDAMK